jgi:signal transduction histidine kinase
MLLLRREREVHELRQERSRVEVWLSVFQSLSHNLRGAAEVPLLENWVEAMVGELAFQVAAVYACDEPAQNLRLLAGIGHVALAPEMAWGDAVQSYLRLNSSGHYSGEGPEEMRPFAGLMGLGTFYWLRESLRGESLLLLAGFAEGSERFHATKPQDFNHFVLLGSHVAALVSNGELIAALDRERSELQESNTQLDIHVRRLREAQRDLLASGKRLTEASRRAGMADIATGVLHNVGNALNSINVSAEILHASVRGMRISGVSRAASLIQQNAADLPGFFADDRRGGKLTTYLVELGTHLVNEQDDLLKQVAALQGHVEHIKAIVCKQQSVAVSFDTSQSCLVEELIEDAISLAEYSLSKHNIVITREHEPVGAIVVDRHKVLQILTNLLKNAQDALLASPQPIKRIVTQLALIEGGHVRITIRDNGVGVTPEALARLFAFGFTTKKSGHGFGLHASAIATEELGGVIRAHSDGPGQGAAFTLELPPRPNATPAPDH